MVHLARGPATILGVYVARARTLVSSACAHLQNHGGALALLACLALPGLAAAQAVVTGSAQAAGGAPLRGVSVYTCLSSCMPVTTTDSSGNFSLSATDLGNASSGTLYFQLAGYYIDQEAFDLSGSPVVGTLQPGGVLIQGTVTDANLQIGIANATVGLQFACAAAAAPCSFASTVSTTTGASGGYSIDSSQILASAQASLSIAAESASAPGYSTYSAGGLAIAAQSAPVTLNLQLTSSSGIAIQGTVTDQNSLAAIPGALVFTCLIACPAVAQTDSNGSYQLSAADINDAPTGVLYFQAGGYFIAQQSYAIVAAPATVNVTLPYVGTVLSGSVADAASQAPISGASVGLQFSCQAAPCTSATTVSAMTGGGGQFTVDASQFLATEAASLQVAAESVSATGYIADQATGLAIPVSSPYPSALGLTLVASAGTAVTGTVTDRGTGHGIPGTNVYACVGCAVLTITDGNGNFTLTGTQLNNAASGTLYFQASGYFLGQQGYTITGAPTSINATLLYGGSFIQGVVSDQLTLLVIDGASVTLQFACGAGPCTAAASVNAQSTTGGRYAIDSSQFLEAGVSSGIALASESVSATAYNTLSASGLNTAIAGYPYELDFALTGSGLTHSITVTTNPAGLNVLIDGNPATAPQTLSWVPGNEHQIATTTPQSGSFISWSDGGALAHEIVVPNADVTFTALFDGAPPAITPQLTGTLGGGGWYTSNVGLTWTVTDPLAQVTSTSGCDPATVTSDTNGTTITCSAMGLGGSSSQSVTIKRDTIAPAAAATPAPLPNAAGWNNSNVTVHFSGTDAGSGIAGCTADIIVSSEGANQSAGPGTCSDVAGNTSSGVSVTGLKIDKTPPTVSTAVSPAANAAGWNNSPVTVTFTGTDSLSGLAPNGCTAPVVLASDGAGQSAHGSCTDLAGNTSAPTVVSPINIDQTPPTATATVTPAPNAAGWNNTSVTVSFSGTDSLNGSGVASCSPSVNLTAEGAGQAASGSCTDRAGNTSQPANAVVNIDKTAPSASITTPPSGANYVYGAAVNAAYGCTDALSGLASCSGNVPNGSAIDTTSGGGTKTFTVTATDKAGNSAVASANYTITTGSFTALPATLNFGTTPLYVTTTMTVTITNTGSLALPLTGIALNAPSFLQSNNCPVYPPATLGVGASCMVSVSFKTVTAGPKNGFLTVSGGLGAGTQNVSVMANGAYSTYSLTPASIAFKNQTDGSASAAVAVTVTNTSTVYLPITSIAVNGTNANQFTQTNNCGSALAVNKTCTVNVVFAPTSSGAKSANVTFTVSGGAPNSSVALTGTGIAPAYTLSPSSVAFASQTVGSSSAATPVTMANSGSVAIPISSITLTGTNANQYSQTNNCGSSLAVNGSCTIRVVFTPTSAGAKSASLSITVSGGAANGSVSLSGTGVVPTYSLSPTSIAFGNENYGVPSAAHPVSMTNTGTLAVPITSIALTGTNANQYSQSNNCGSSLGVGASCTINVVFTPTSAGSKSATVSVTVGGGGATGSVPLTGTGIVPTYTLAPTSLAFGSVAHGTTSAAKSVTLTNTGTLSLPITSIALTGANASQYTQTNTCGSAVAGGASCTINVSFAPTTTGSKPATLSVTPGGGASAQSVSLTGTGT